jgi:hypothetical protein
MRFREYLMGASLWHNELTETKMAEREQALEQICHLIRIQGFTIDEITPFFKGASLKDVALNSKESSRLYDPFFDAW